MSITNIIIISVVVFYTAHKLSKDYFSGLKIVLFFLILLPHVIRLEFGGAIPAFTIHRFLIILLLIYSWRYHRHVNVSPSYSPVTKLLFLLLAVQIISAIGSKVPTAGIKVVFSLIFEVIIFHFILIESLQSTGRYEASVEVLESICKALLVVGILAIIERYTGFNVVDEYIQNRRIGTMHKDIMSTFNHRIHLGYAMAAGSLLFAGIGFSVINISRRLISLLCSYFLLAVCYFSMSRGPWLGAVFSWVIYSLIGGSRARKSLLILCLLAFMIAYIRPGVGDTVESLLESTFSSETTKGQSYEYRWKLWGVAFSEIKKSPFKLAFGYGGNSTDFMDLSHYFGHHEGGTTELTGFTSWDNQFASDLIEFGVLGFTLNILIILYVLLKAIKLRSVKELPQGLPETLISCILLFIFGMTNVGFTSPQIIFLFWTIASVVISIEKLSQTDGYSNNQQLTNAL